MPKPAPEASGHRWRFVRHWRWLGYLPTAIAAIGFVILQIEFWIGFRILP